MAGTKTNYFNVLKLRACAKLTRLHCKQAKESLMIFIFLTEFLTDVLRKIRTIHRWYVRSTMLPLESPWDSQSHR